MLDLTTSTPSDIMSLSVEEVIELASSLSDIEMEEKLPMTLRHKVIAYMYSIFNYQLSNDLLLALLVNTKQQLILAPAGGCKTSSSQTKLISNKIFWKKLYNRYLTANECLCLVYNAENRIQMDQKHTELLSPLVMSNFVSYDVNNPSYVNAGISSHTLHSFSNYWIKQYLDKLKLSKFDIITEDYALSFFTSAINKVKLSDANLNNQKLDISVDRFQTLYDLVAGLTLSYDDILNNHPQLLECIQTCTLEPKDIVAVFQNYDNMKRFFKKYDFTDMLKYMNELLSDDEVRARMHILYPFLIVDEVQDFTPLMMSILKKLVGEDTRLLAIGDEDQSIYGFRGADVNNAVKFTEHFPESKVFQLLVNRRCGENILQAADKVIHLNKNRYEKQLQATRANGVVDFMPYLNESDQLRDIVHAIGGYDKHDLADTVVCMREKIYGQPLSYELFKNGIPFYCFNTLRFDRHEGFRGFIDIMKLLLRPTKENWPSFYKCINVKKDDWFKYIGYDVKKKEITKFEGIDCLWDLDFEPFMSYKGFAVTVKKLENIYRNINTYNASEYVEYIITLYKQNFWDYRASMSRIPFEREVFEWILDIFNKDMIFPAIFATFTDRVQTCMNYQRTKTGVAIATLHALKGLEYKNVHIAYLDDAIFPAFASIDGRNYPKQYALDLKEAENRLAYVAFTRAKDKLVLHYSKINPSLYVQLLENKGTTTVQSSELGLDEQLFKPAQMVFSNKKVW